jgi:hypothetical protein
MKSLRKVYYVLFLAPTFLNGELLISEASQSQETPNSNSVFRLDVLLINKESKDIHVTSKSEITEGINPLNISEDFVIGKHGQKVVSFYFKINENALAGAHDIDILFFSEGQQYKFSKKIYLSQKYSIDISPQIFKSKKGILTVTNNSNFSLNYEGTIIPAYSSKKITIKFEKNDEINETLSKKHLSFYDEQNNKYDAEILYLISSEQNNTFFDDRKYYVFPFNLSTSYAHGSSSDTYTTMISGGGKFAPYQSIQFKGSVPFYHNYDSYTYFDPRNAIFYLNYFNHGLNLIAGDTYFENNSYFYYRSGRGYTTSYESPNQYKCFLGFVEKNQFYRADENDWIFSIGKNSLPKVIYRSWLFGSKYNQNMEVLIGKESEKKTFTNSFQLFNTNFNTSKNYGGGLWNLLYATEKNFANLWIDYIGNAFYGRNNSEFKVAANYSRKSNKLPYYFNAEGFYNSFFPRHSPKSIISRASSSFGKNFSKQSHSVNFVYNALNSYYVDRNNYTLFYNLYARLHKNVSISGAQGLTYYDIYNTGKTHSLNNYSKIDIFYQIYPISLSTGFSTQQYFFSDLKNQQNNYYINANLNLPKDRLSLYINYGNSSFYYKFSGRASYQKKFLGMTYDIEYQLNPLPFGYDHRLLVKIDYNKLFKIAKKTKVTTSFIDTNTNRPINNANIYDEDLNTYKVENGTLSQKLPEESLYHIFFDSQNTSMDLKTNYTPDLIEKKYEYSVNFRGKVIGNIEFSSNITRESMKKLVYKQNIMIKDSQGQEFFVQINDSGSFSIKNLTVGKYEIYLDTSDLPAGFSSEPVFVTIDYANPIHKVDLSVSFD